MSAWLYRCQFCSEVHEAPLRPGGTVYLRCLVTREWGWYDPSGFLASTERRAEGGGGPGRPTASRRGKGEASPRRRVAARRRTATVKSAHRTSARRASRGRRKKR
jgi:hypothetical protein